MIHSVHNACPPPEPTPFCLHEQLNVSLGSYFPERADCNAPARCPDTTTAASATKKNARVGCVRGVAKIFPELDHIHEKQACRQTQLLQFERHDSEGLMAGCLCAANWL